MRNPYDMLDFLLEFKVNSQILKDLKSKRNRGEKFTLREFSLLDQMFDTEICRLKRIFYLKFDETLVNYWDRI